MSGSAMNLVHVLDPAWAGMDAALGVRASSVMLPEFIHHSVIAGSRADELACHALGAAAGDRVPIPAGLAMLAARPLARWLRTRVRQFGGAERVAGVLVWSSRLAPTVARVVASNFGPDMPVTMMLTAGPRHRGADLRLWTQSGTGAARLGAACFDDDLADAWVDAGIMRPGVVTPPVVEAFDWAAARAAARAELEIAPSETVAALLADPLMGGDARLFCWVIGVVKVAGNGVTGVMPSATPQMRRAARYLRLHRREWDVIAHRGCPTIALAAADIIVWDQDARRTSKLGGWPMGGLLSAKLAASKGVPIITTASGMSRRMLHAAPGWCRAGAATMPGLGAPLLAMTDDPALRRQVGESLARSIDARADNAAFAADLRVLIASRRPASLMPIAGATA